MEEFSEGILTIFTEKYEVLIELIFDFYDFDKDGLISKEDILVVFSFITLKSKILDSPISSIKFKYENDDGDYKYRVESQEEITNYTNIMFESKSVINLSEFKIITEEKSSEAFLFVIIIFNNLLFNTFTVNNIPYGK